MKKTTPKLLLLACLLRGSIAFADWPADAGLDVPVANVDHSETPAVVADQNGGIFVIFSHQDGTPSSTLRGEHFNATGDRLWGVVDSDGGVIGIDLLGMSIGAANGGKTQAFSDGDGGFVVAYTPGGGEVPYSLDVQRFYVDATPAWTPTGTFGGVQLLATPGYYSYFWAVPDQTGGALVNFIGGAGIVGQRIDSTGAIDYGTGYDFVGAQTPGVTYAPSYINGDGWGGLYYIWPNSGSASVSPIIDHLDPSGNLTFQVSSVAPEFSPADEWTLSGLADGGGCWAAWYQGIAPSAIYLQLFANDAGAVLSSAPGDAGGLLVATTAANIVANPTLIADGTGGVVVVWSDVVNSNLNVIYAQRYSADGTALWGAHPILVNGAETPASGPEGYLPNYRLVATADDNVAIFWTGTPKGIYAEKIAVDGGSKLWGALSGGVAVSTVAPQGIQWLDATFAEDDSAYVTYQTGAEDIYIKHLLPDGTLGPTPAVVDAGPTDDGGSELDAGPVEDAGEDAGPVDAGSTEDAGPDAGPAHPDAGPDAGTVVDAGGGTPDAGTPDAGTTPASSSGCSTARAGSVWELGLFAIGLTLLRRRFRRR